MASTLRTPQKIVTPGNAMLYINTHNMYSVHSVQYLSRKINKRRGRGGVYNKERGRWLIADILRMYTYMYMRIIQSMNTFTSVDDGTINSWSSYDINITNGVTGHEMLGCV